MIILEIMVMSTATREKAAMAEVSKDMVVGNSMAGKAVMVAAINTAEIKAMADNRDIIADVSRKAGEVLLETMAVKVVNVVLKIGVAREMEIQEVTETGNLMIKEGDLKVLREGVEEIRETVTAHREIKTGAVSQRATMADQMLREREARKAPLQVIARKKVLLKVLPAKP
jgi:hypothetical protein